MAEQLGFQGFGEAGRAIAQGLRLPSVAHDIVPDTAACRALGVTPVDLVGLAAAGIVFCLVTADQAVAAAEAAAAHLAPGMLWLDGNSCSPGAKRQAAAVIEAARGRYVDLAIMAPIRPHLHQTPMLVSGPHADAALDVLTLMGMRPKRAGDRVGDASSIKMLRSVIVKGLEALTAESFLAARKAGVDRAVIASLQASDPGIDWLARGAYNLERMLVHGTRRAAEMEEVAATLRELGLPDRMARATADWQAELAALKLEPGPSSGPEDFATRADAILKARG
jgi:3-hydroxyisobutyrate dehydrogenase-like beta-hydroxyacid dehydrogenase